ncbi:DUF1709-domain-containing protein [Xylaria palmicola]|nr:DUF1709-domain-containing protein [Xylaria palmicola]
MASEQPITEPLRISKTTPTHSPTKGGLGRPLSEISATEKRRNSPSWTSTSKKMALNTDSSPFQSSPLEAASSPRMFWQNRNANKLGENDLYGGRAGSPSPTKRSSIERLQKASRVKNSTMFAREQKQEYDPTRIATFERPLAKVQGNAFAGSGHAGFRSSHARTESQTSVVYSPTKTITSPTTPSPNRPPTPSKDQPSPTKSSLLTSRFKSSYDSQNEDVFSDHSVDETVLSEGRYLHRHAKSVTFDAAPPQINEYEMATPDLSSVGTNSREGSFESEEDDDIYGPYPGEDGELPDDSFDATLEDTDKTPVVGPDDWRRDVDTRFDSSPMPEGGPTQSVLSRPQHRRNNSSTSSGEHRPLPPLPGLSDARTGSPASPNGQSRTPEQVVGSLRDLPTPPPVSPTKSEIHNIGNSNMSLEERLRLMMLSDETSPKLADKSAKMFAEQQRERRMRRAGARDRIASSTPEHEASQTEIDGENDEADDTLGDISGLDMDYELPSISRQSILRRVNGNQELDGPSDYHFASPGPDSSPLRSTPYDPDVPIASIEDSVLEDFSELDEDSFVRDEENGEDDIVGEIRQRLGDDDDTYSDKSKGRDDDDESHYSEESPDPGVAQKDDNSSHTPRPASPAEGEVTNFSATIPQVNNSRTSDFSRSFQSYMLPKPKESDLGMDEMNTEPEKQDERQEDKRRPRTPKLPISKPEYDGSGWGDPEDEDEPGTPESVIHHPISDDESDYEEEEPLEEEPVESPAIPERVATIKASSSKLKTRPSATPSDIEAMREARRQVSREVAPHIPPIPERHRSRLSRDYDMEPLTTSNNSDFVERHPSFKKRSLTLDLDLGLSLDQDFERVIEAQKVKFQQATHHVGFEAASTSHAGQASSPSQEHLDMRSTTSSVRFQLSSNANLTTRKQRGYLMRQNTKLVTASDKDNEDLRTGIRSAGNSPVKQHQQRPQSWTVEPWNGNQKRSLRKRHGPSLSGPVPPLPGQETNATAMNSVPEEETSELATEECGERGRLFVKVMGVKDLDLPLPRNERTWFSLTLDNGVHCVTTAWLELARNAPIGQEFELVVPNDLEFQLTLNVKLEKPKVPKHVPASPTKMPKPKTSAFSRVFASPRKRKEMEARQRAEEEAYAQAQWEVASKLSVAPTGWDLLSPLTAEDGSFARSYVCLKEHESRCYGRPYMVEIAAFNEWATEEAGFASSVKSKRSGMPNNSVVRRAPYKIGKLEVQLLFVPRAKGSSDDDMPKSMNSCIRELKAAEERLSRNWEGHLSQQGGDCPYWRRRYFKLVGTKLTAYHETTRQPRATINLSNAKRLIDDRRQLTNPETTGRNGKRRRSAFAEEEEGYMFVEEGFRIRFNNGEVIDFYADTPEDKDGWMKVLGDVTGRSGEDDDGTGVNSRRKWCELVLKREESVRKRAESRPSHARTKSMIV